MAKKLTIIGVGRLGRSLIEVLPDDWGLALVDVIEEPLASIGDVRDSGPVVKVCGDASSRLVLDEIGLSANDVVAITTGSDAVNLEVAGLLRDHYDVVQVVCVVQDRRGVPEALSGAVEIVERAQALANLVFNRLCWSESRGVSLGLGEGELLEIGILEGSAAINRPLKTLHPQRWLVAAVYREGRLVIPHGDTVLAAGDRVLLVGEPSVLRNVGAFVRGGEPVFPLQFGPNIGTCVEDGVEDEARWLCEHTRAEDVVTVDPSILMPSEAGELPADVLRKLGVGCLVIKPMPIHWMARMGLRRSQRKRVLIDAQVPVLVARGGGEVRGVLLTVGLDHQINALAHVAIDIARLCGAELTVLTVLPPSLSRGDAQLEPLRAIPKKVAHIARLFDVKVNVRHAEGNPIATIREHAQDFDLLVLGASKGRRNSLLTPDISLFLLHDAPCSTLFVPWATSHQ